MHLLLTDNETVPISLCMVEVCTLLAAV